MTANRAQRRAMKATAQAAALLASRCYDFQGMGDLVRITAPQSIAALTRALALLLRFGGEPVAVPIAKAEAQGSPLKS